MERGSDVRAWASAERLLDGRTVLIRAIRPGDKQALADGFQRLSDESVYHRFFSSRRGLSRSELEYLTEIDFVNHVALLAVLEEEGRELAVGVGRYIVPAADPGLGEVALTVDDGHQGLGIGTLLLRHLGAIGQSRGIREFRADVLPDNRQMMRVLEKCGFGLRTRTSAGLVSVSLSLGETVT